mmetsp:Transcript_44042/g.84158  ORF Transcript_44042/g.84158 Transcript_44042/m.84158 type:complete len:235 (+) Transcript_44042:2361-3065(+)
MLHQLIHTLLHRSQALHGCQRLVRLRAAQLDLGVVVAQQVLLREDEDVRVRPLGALQGDALGLARAHLVKVDAHRARVAKPNLSTPPTQPPHGDACVLVLLAHELGAARRRRRRLGHHGLRATWVVSLHRALVAGPEPVAVRPLPALAHQRVVGSPQAIRPVTRRVAQGVVPGVAVEGPFIPPGVRGRVPDFHGVPLGGRRGARRHGVAHAGLDYFRLAPCSSPGLSREQGVEY